MTSTLGVDGRYRDPLWRVDVELTPLEQELLRCWWVRRLGFISHAGASSFSTVQTYSRLEHSLGLLALVAHFAPDDEPARAAALLHDIGHLPFSHTMEGIGDLDHHDLGTSRIQELSRILRSHGTDPSALLDLIDGRRASPLHGSTGGLRLDHLDSFVRSGRAHGRTLESPTATLAKLRLVDGAIDTDSTTGRYLAELVAGEARRQTSSENLIANALVRDLAAQLMSGMRAAALADAAAMTDHEFWALLLTDPRTRDRADAVRRDPARWSLTDSIDPGAGAISVTLTRLYLDLPLVDGVPMPRDPALFADLPTPPWTAYITAGEHLSPVGGP